MYIRPVCVLIEIENNRFILLNGNTINILYKLKEKLNLLS